MPNEPIWLPARAVIDINQELVEQTGENHALLFADKLDSALARPINAYLYEEVYDTVTLSVNLMLALGQAHPFEQGNKRTAFYSGLNFLLDNGYELLHPDTTEFAKDFEAAVMREMPPEVFEQIIAPWIESLPEEAEE
ncbi:type II toxin-antitoxin system death-on-curing family toxin (plasmid) [Sinorhizobium medicae]|uniref:type II toxin-antitoxin system death-on-curing family toxin n=1 Tax=Sinorhizobium medicae TaxID=110321 RepID=UPI002AF6BAA4|nr:type II toxin-antitoxin system death-on-curing family toxin [Sinorhizobium medicae]WQO48319.1 type II toxin-antitoxin system death-on-curing family toxin [Sinorhizobium medicae]WQO68734.1 type II toxin-antitoxin system death-on-curing family toxin [Sinorhizobium medicae]WQO75771.1 type II toxin-antitoxin system death-on-curing family toxin [Sinorhizobium medicae]WQO94936.1 type II toxin-antitoxin system death-on-curing family toxin [Sinorhizobium medicae]